MAHTTSLVFNGGVIPSPSPAPAGSGKAKLLKIGEITVTEQEVQVTKKVICDPDSITTVAPFMEVLTSAKLAELISANSILVLDNGTVQYLMADATVVVEDGTSVCTSVSFLGLSLEDRAKVLYPCTRITDELTLQQVLEVGEPVETNFDLVKAYPEDTEAGTLIDKLMVEDTVQGPDDQTLLEVVQSEDGEGHTKVAINEDNLRRNIDDIYNSIDGINETIDEMDFDSIPRAYLASTLNQSPGDNVSTRTTIDVFSVTAIEGDCFEFEQTTTIDDTPFGYVWIEPGTYLINAAVTLQWVGNPRGTFIAKVGSVMGENFDFSQEQEIKRNTTKVVTIPSRMKLAVNVTYDAGIPVMGFWIQSMQVVKLAGGMSQTTVAHGLSLEGNGSVENPLDISEHGLQGAFDYAKDKEYFATKQEIAPLATQSALQAETARATQRENEIEALFVLPTQEAVDAWLEAHPEATTTVENNSIGSQKLVPSFREQIQRKYKFSSLSELKAYPHVGNFNGLLVSTCGYYSPGDGGGAEYLIHSGSTSFDDFTAVELASGYYAELVSINEHGFIDARWAGAKADGVTDDSAALDKCIKESNRLHLTPIRIIGNMYIGTAIDVIGDLCLYGETRPAPSLITINNLPNFQNSNPSKLILGSDITAFNCIGLGSATSTGTKRFNVHLERLEVTGAASSIFINVSAFGAPSRPSLISDCYIHDLGTFFRVRPPQGSTKSTCMYNFEIRNNFIMGVQSVFNVNSFNANQLTFGGLNIHDNTIEMCGSIDLHKLFGSNFICNNLLEGNIGDFKINLARGSVTLRGNYYEANEGKLAITSNQVENTVVIGDDYIYNAPNFELSVSNVTLTMSPHDYPAKVSYNDVIFRNNLPVNLRGRALVASPFTAVHSARLLAPIENDSRVHKWNSYSTTLNGVSLKNISGYTRTNYAARMKVTEGELYAIVFASNFDGQNLVITYVDNLGQIGYGLDGPTITVKKSINIIFFRATQTNAGTGGAIAFNVTGGATVPISDISFVHIDSTANVYSELVNPAPGLNDYFLA